MNRTLGLPLGPGGRRAVIAAGVIGLLVASLSTADGGAAPVRELAAGWTAGPPGPPVAASAGRFSSRALALGMRLLDLAARAARQTSYQGEQVISWRTPGGGWLGLGGGTVTVDVRHRRGVGTLTRVTASPAAAWSDLPAGPAGQQDGTLGLTPALVGLLGTHYAVAFTGTGSAGGRAARIVEALRADGSVAARFWLDTATALPLRRQLFDARDQLVSDDGFSRLTLGSPATKVAYAPFRPWAELGPPQLAALRSGGWAAPRLLPGDLTLFDVRRSATAAGDVVDLAYSDGLSVVSVFEQRGQLPAALPGWHRTGPADSRLYVNTLGEPDLTWSSGGFVYTVVAAAPAELAAAAVGALPHRAEPGFWGRIERGLCRLASWLNPFR